MKKVLLTGSNGIVGRILKLGLEKNYILSLLDLPESDARDYKTVLDLSKDKDAIIHLAWNTKTENGNAKKIDVDNTRMWGNIFEAALRNKVRRVIMASSIHATDYKKLSEQGLVTVEQELPSPKIYGVHKKELEKKGKVYASKGLEVVCIRLGGICAEDEKSWEGLKRDGLAYPDLVSLFSTCLDVRKVPGNYVILYGVSNNKNPIFDLSNPFKWMPELDAAKFYKIK